MNARDGWNGFIDEYKNGELKRFRCKGTLADI